ncbi:hypothetical protein [Prolixibacter sp. SD074]|uniref:hypothetical protein n=1 Tax=Prolixibacter sp. SD074 TaxID=2652391 RepID=UPI0012768260|nr:hypothetical protein [Prolixibacter sp. SD074]GET30808.1 hypothetical protein SD074_30100 [Prolixibacter sp. SD074]
MKNIFIYYLVILLPFIPLVWLVFSPYILTFVIALLFYATIYRGLTDYFRLRAKGYKGYDLRRLFIPFYGHIKYFKALYLK